MKKTVACYAMAAVLMIGGLGFAIERGIACAAVRDVRRAAVRELEEAIQLTARHPGAFGDQAPVAADAPLKSLAQEVAAKHGVAVAFLSESEREADGGRRERQVIVRLTHPAHRKLVGFLGELESRGGGARIKEIHVRPSSSKSDHYEEAEVVVSRLSEPESP